MLSPIYTTRSTCPPSRPFEKTSRRVASGFFPKSSRMLYFPRDKFSTSLPVFGKKEERKEGRKEGRLEKSWIGDATARSGAQRAHYATACDALCRFPVHRSRIRFEMCVSRTDRRYGIGFSLSLGYESIQLPRSRVNSYASRRASGSLGHDGARPPHLSFSPRSFLFPLDGAEDDPRLNRRIHAVAVRRHTRV